MSLLSRPFGREKLNQTKIQLPHMKISVVDVLSLFNI